MGDIGGCRVSLCLYSTLAGLEDLRAAGSLTFSGTEGSMAGFIIMDFKFSSNTLADNEVASLNPADKVQKMTG